MGIHYEEAGAFLTLSKCRAKCAQSAYEPTLHGYSRALQREPELAAGFKRLNCTLANEGNQPHKAGITLVQPRDWQSYEKTVSRYGSAVPSILLYKIGYGIYEKGLTLNVDLKVLPTETEHAAGFKRLR